MPEYVRAPTPMVLRSDTTVTNHGFVEGRATPFLSVLQARTAVLVDEYGMPRARCSCGNPRTPADRSEGPYTGDAWAGFSPAAITTVNPAGVPISDFTLVDPFTETAFTRPRGTDGEQDRTWAAPDRAPPTTTQPPAVQPRSQTQTSAPTPPRVTTAPVSPPQAQGPPPSVQAEPTSEESQVEVRADSDWQSTGVVLGAGDVLAIEYVGSLWSPFPVHGHGKVPADGQV